MLPNICPGVLSAAFISVALVLGEYTFASLLHYDTLPVQIALLGKSDGHGVRRGRRWPRSCFAVPLLLGLAPRSAVTAVPRKDS